MNRKEIFENKKAEVEQGLADAKRWTRKDYIRLGFTLLGPGIFILIAYILLLIFSEYVGDKQDLVFYGVLGLAGVAMIWSLARTICIHDDRQVVLLALLRTLIRNEEKREYNMLSKKGQAQYDAGIIDETKKWKISDYVILGVMIVLAGAIVWLGQQDFVHEEIRVTGKNILYARIAAVVIGLGFVLSVIFGTGDQKEKEAKQLISVLKS